MGDRSTFADDEWEQLQWAVMMAGSHVSGSDYPGFWDSMKEAAAGSRFLAMLTTDENALVADLAKHQGRRRPHGVRSREDLAGELALAHIRAAAALVQAKAPEDLADFRDMIVALATIVADGVNGTSDREAEAVERVRIAVGAGPAAGEAPEG
jgi:hypothetical protein